MLKTILFEYRTSHVLFFSTFDMIPHTYAIHTYLKLNASRYSAYIIQNIFDAEEQVFVSRSKYFHFEKLVHDDCVLKFVFK